MYYTSFIYIIDKDPVNRQHYTQIIDESHPGIFKNFFNSVKEAVELLENKVIAAPDYIFVAQNAVTTQMHSLLGNLRCTAKGKKIRIVFFGPEADNNLQEKASAYSGQVLQLPSYTTLPLDKITESVRRLYE